MRITLYSTELDEGVTVDPDELNYNAFTAWLGYLGGEHPDVVRPRVAKIASAAWDDRIMLTTCARAFGLEVR